MKAIDEGGSTLLDNSMLLYTSYMADGGHGRTDYPALLVGKGGGTLKGGRQLDFPKKTPVANLYLELQNRMGVAATTFRRQPGRERRGVRRQTPRARVNQNPENDLPTNHTNLQACCRRRRSFFSPRAKARRV